MPMRLLNGIETSGKCFKTRFNRRAPSRARMLQQQKGRRNTVKKVLIVFSAVMLLSSFSVAFADGDAASLFKTHCLGCHGADGSRVPASGIEPIKGQSDAELLKKLEGYKDGSFGGPRKQVMENVVKRLSDEQLKSLAEYASKL